MEQRNAFFGTISSIDRAEHGGIVVTLDGDVRLVIAAKFIDLLHELYTRRMPVYLEAGDLLEVTRVRIPDVVHVATVDGNTVTFMESQVRAEARDDEILSELRKAAATGESIAVTITDDFVVIDVRPFPAPPRETVADTPPLREMPCVSKQRARGLFDLCAATTCNPLTVPPPCTPFLYPDDGCWARANQMTAIMMVAGVTSRKLWIDGTLKTATKNNPNCYVKWSWHVAPIVCIRVHPLLPFWKQELVIDPSLFTGPVSPATWKSVQGDPSATLQTTSSEVYLRAPSGGVETDPTFAKTERDLTKYRLKLQARSLSIGPPPYNCP